MDNRSDTRGLSQHYLLHVVLSDINLALHSDLEKSVEELQRNSSVNHGLVTEQDVEQKSKELRMLGETLTELKSKCRCDLLVCLEITVMTAAFLVFPLLTSQYAPLLSAATLQFFLSVSVLLPINCSKFTGQLLSKSPTTA